MRVEIYQIDMEKDEMGIKFHDIEFAQKLLGTDEINAELYEEVFSAELDIEDPEEVYQIFNTEGHPLHRGHSMSVSDVIVMNGKAYYCQRVGFAEVEFDEKLTHKPDNLMRVVYVEPGKPAYQAEIGKTLEAEQKAVGGLIEAIYYDDNICLIANEESKLIGMSGNRRIGDGTSIIAGPFFVCGIDGENFRSLSEEEVVKYMDEFSVPEEISREEVEADTGFTMFFSM